MTGPAWGGLRGRPAAGDAEAVVAMVERYESPQSAALVRFWLERQPRAFWCSGGRGATSRSGSP